MVDLIGERFNKLVVLKECPDKNPKEDKWLCKCDCGNYTSAYGYRLKAGRANSCGCTARNKPRHGHSIGGKLTPEYKTWKYMMRRCYNKKSKSYKGYGDRGIKVCERWHTFDNFLKDMGSKPRPISKYSIERKDFNGDYEPENCEWADATTQARNKGLSSQNTSGVKGVGWSKQHNKWRARITVNKKTIELGWFDKKEDAVKARKNGEEKYFKRTC